MQTQSHHIFSTHSFECRASDLKLVLNAVQHVVCQWLLVSISLGGAPHKLCAISTTYQLSLVLVCAAHSKCAELLHQIQSPPTIAVHLSCFARNWLLACLEHNQNQSSVALQLMQRAFRPSMSSSQGLPVLVWDDQDGQAQNLHVMHA